MLGITDECAVKKNKNKRKRRNVTFNDEEYVINPEDIDPNVGRFRNLIQTTIVPTKRAKIDKLSSGSFISAASSDMNKHLSPNSFMPQLYQGLPPVNHSHNDPSSSKDDSHSIHDPMSPTLGSKLGLLLPNPAPEVTPNSEAEPTPVIPFGVGQTTSPNKLDDSIDNDPNEPRKKKYAKEAWPGRKPLLSGL